MSSTITPAMINYEVDGKAQQIRFHAVMSEAHQAKSEITAYPVATGFEVSRHSIKKNDKVVIKAMFSNTVLENSNNSDVSGTNIQRLMFENMKALVNNSYECSVVTNLYHYKNVVFDNFSTETKAGYTDAIEVTIAGQDLQLRGTLNKTAPTPLSFTLLTPEQAAVRRDELSALGIVVSDEATLSECQVDVGTDFSFNTVDELGLTLTNTYVCTGQDPTTGNYGYDVHTDTGEVYAANEDTVFNMFSLTDAAGTASSCLVENLVDYAEEEANKVVKTALGELTKSVYGAYYEAINMAGDGGPLLAIGIDCVVAGALGGVGAVSPDDFDSTLPSADDISKSATVVGTEAYNTTVGAVAPSTFTKISGGVINGL